MLATIVLTACSGSGVNGTSMAQCGPAVDPYVTFSGIENPAVQLTSVSLAVAHGIATVTFHGSGPFESLVPPGTNPGEPLDRNLPTASDVWGITFFRDSKGSTAFASVTVDNITVSQDATPLDNDLWFDAGTGNDGANGEGLTVTDTVSGDDLIVNIAKLRLPSTFEWYASSIEDTHTDGTKGGGAFSCPSGYNGNSSTLSEITFPGSNVVTATQPQSSQG